MIRNFWMSARGSFRYLQNTTSLRLSSSDLPLKFTVCLVVLMVLGEEPGEKGENMPPRSVAVGGIMMIPDAIPPHPLPHSLPTHICVGCSHLLSEHGKGVKASSFWKCYRTFPAEDFGFAHSNRLPEHFLDSCCSWSLFLPKLFFIFLLPKLQTCILIWRYVHLILFLPQYISCISDPILIAASQKIRTNVSGTENGLRKRKSNEDFGLANSLPGGQSEQHPEWWIGHESP